MAGRRLPKPSMARSLCLVQCAQYRNALSFPLIASSVTQQIQRRLYYGKSIYTTLAQFVRGPATDTEDKEEFHHYTAGRYVVNEAQEMANRYVPFNLEALLDVATKAVGASSCISVHKLPEGNYNKALLLVMADMKQVVAKLPNPNAGRPHFTTASEVATIDYVRDKLKIPVPKVYAWCSRADQTPVGSGYIIMEKLEGVLLSSMLSKMDVKQRWRLTRTIVDYQVGWYKCFFPKHGSLYYKTDLPKELCEEDEPDDEFEDQFAVGPITGVAWNENGISSMDIDFGPWDSALDYYKAVGERELAVIRNLEDVPKPKSDASLCGPGTYVPTREKKLRAIQCYFDLLNVMLPKDTNLLEPTLWHPDLHADNILVDPEDPTKITGIIDWQATEIIPVLGQVVVPAHIRHPGPQPKYLNRPKLPPDYKDLLEHVRQEEDQLYYRQNLNSYVEMCSNVWESLKYRSTACGEVLSVPCAIMRDDEALYLKKALPIIKKSLRKPCDLIDPAARERLAAILKDEQSLITDWRGMRKGEATVDDMRANMGDLFPSFGLVNHECYDASKIAMANIKKQVVRQLARTEKDRIAWDKAWPFDN